MADLEYRLTKAPFSEPEIQELVGLAGKIFGSANATDISWRLEKMPDVTCFAAWSDGVPIGFKIGYALTSVRYYSWLGGVDQAFRRQGIAQALMDRQHAWIPENGYISVETGAQQDNLAMTRLNHVSGFQVVGIRFKNLGPDVTYEKRFDG